MKLSVGARRGLLVAACFSGVVGLGVGAGYMLGFLPSFEEKCAAQCHIKGLEGHMVYVHPRAITAGMRSRGPKECKCFRVGTYNPLTEGSQ